MYRVSFSFTETATTEIYTLSLHDALPIYLRGRHERQDRPRRPAHGCATGLRHDPYQYGHLVHRHARVPGLRARRQPLRGRLDRKSTRLNSSHTVISYAVFCLKKKTK